MRRFQKQFLCVLPVHSAFAQGDNHILHIRTVEWCHLFPEPVIFPDHFFHIHTSKASLSLSN
ncbi:hypothetical protein D3C71_1290760 [compost metagenome]